MFCAEIGLTMNSDKCASLSISQGKNTNTKFAIDPKQSTDVFKTMHPEGDYKYYKYLRYLIAATKPWKE